MSAGYPLITVIVPTYKNFVFLKDTLHSIYLQDYPSIEILITDDGSDNYDEAFVQSLAAEASPHIRVQVFHHSKNLGTVKNLNSAIVQAEGEFICFLGSDDLLFEPSTLSTAMGFFKTKTMVVTGQTSIINEDGSPYNGPRFKHPSPFFYRLPGSVLYCYMLAQGNIYSAPGALYRRSVFDEAGLYDEKFKYIEDYPFWLLLTRKGIGIGYIPHPVVTYRLGGISTNSSGSGLQQAMKQETYQTYAREYELLPRSFLGNILKEFIALQIKCNLLDCDTQNIVSRHLKNPLFVRVLRKGMVLFKLIIDKFNF